MNQEQNEKDQEELGSSVTVTRRTVNADDKSSNLFFPAKTKKCGQCHEVLSSDHFWTHRGRGDGLQSYCKDCSKTYGKTLKCSRCGQDFKILHRNVYRRKTFLCPPCLKSYISAKVAEQNMGRTKEEVRTKKGYKIERPANAHGYLLSHRRVVENHVQRKLERWEVVHHIDGDKRNNAVENLFLTDASGHQKAHASLDQIAYRLIVEGEIVFDSSIGKYKMKDKG